MIAQLIVHSLPEPEVQGSCPMQASLEIFYFCVWWYSSWQWFFIFLYILSFQATLFRIQVNWTTLILSTLIFSHSWSPMILNLLAYGPLSNFQQGTAMFTASWVQPRLELPVCNRYISVDVITSKFIGLNCSIETKIQIFCMIMLIVLVSTLLKWDLQWLLSFDIAGQTVKKTSFGWFCGLFQTGNLHWSHGCATDSWPVYSLSIAQSRNTGSVSPC